MNNSVIEHPRGLFSYQLYGKINSKHQKVPSGEVNSLSFRRKYKLPLTSREFGREIALNNNLTTYNYHNVIKTKRTFDQKILNLVREKAIHNNQIRNYERNIMDLKRNNNNNRYLKNNFINKNIENKENNINLINTKKNIIDDIIIDDENEDKDNNSIINNDDEVFYEIKEENQNNRNKINVPDIYNKYPQNVDEYFDDIVSELKNKEEKYLPKENYMANQKDINHRMRAILIDWLIDVHIKYKMVPQTMYISVNLIDRFLSENKTNRDKLQLVGVASMFIASKYEEIYPPELKDFVYITDKAYVKSEVLEMEYKMLKYLNFDITFPTQWSFLEIFKKKLDLDQKTFYLAWFLMELSLINYKMLKFKYSQIAASAVLIAIKTLNYYNIVEFEKNTGYNEKDIEECVKEIINFNIYNLTHSLQAIRKKFSTRKYDEVSKIQVY